METRRALIVYGGWDGHEPRECCARVTPEIEAAGLSVNVLGSLAAFDRLDALERYDVIVPAWTMGNLETHQEEALVGAVKAGAGIAGWHGGMGDAFRGATEFQFMVGGQFVAHPGGITDYDVDVVDGDHPVMRGVERFSMRSEQYYMHVDPSNRVLAATNFGGTHCPWIDGCRMPVVWTRQYGKGRVFYCSLGHAAAEFDVPQVETIVTRGILWAAGALD